MSSGAMGWLFLALGTGCGSSELPERLQIVDFENDEYRIVEASAGSLTELSPLRARSAAVLTGAQITFSTTFPRDRGLDRDRFVDGAEAATPRVRTRSGVAVPQDLDSLGILTGFVHLDRAIDAFAEEGVLFPDQVPVYYAPQFSDAVELSLPVSDNAAYLPELDAFALLPTEVLPGVPLAMNPGVAFHELSHRLFYYRAFGAELFSVLDRESGRVGAGATFNRLRAVDEGVADFFAASFMNDPSYLDASVVGTTIGEERDLVPIRLFPTIWLDGIEPRSGEAYDPYGVGVLFASTLWAIAGDYGQRETRTALLDGLSAIRPALVETFDFEFGDLMREVVAALPGDRQTACSHVFERYGAAYPRVSGVCP